jgi:hypothetical protein
MKREVNTQFFTYSQNNSGGRFTNNDNVAEYVIIEAISADDANTRAEDIGLYFDGDGDCPCCGDRWSRAWKGDGTDEPTIYGQKLSDVEASYYRNQVIIHYFDGTKERYEFKKKDAPLSTALM